MKLTTPYLFDHYKISKEGRKWFLTGFTRNTKTFGPKEGPFKTSHEAIEAASDVGKICMSLR